jgi:hypothetical protein
VERERRKLLWLQVGKYYCITIKTVAIDCGGAGGGCGSFRSPAL